MGVEIYIIPRGDEEKYNLGKTRSGFDVALREICTGKRYFTLPLSMNLRRCSSSVLKRMAVGTRGS